MIRSATQNDIPVLSDMLTALFTIESDFSPDTEAQTRGLQLMLDEPDSRPIWVAVEANNVVGMCSLQILVSTALGSRVGLVEDVFVSEGHREKGVGRDLLNHATSWAKDNGLARLQLFCDIQNFQALEFYKRTSWTRTRLLGIRKHI